jgi:hypothetical protein
MCRLSMLITRPKMEVERQHHNKHQCASRILDMLIPSLRDIHENPARGDAKQHSETKRHSMSQMTIVVKMSDNIIIPTSMPALYMICPSLPSEISVATQAQQTPSSILRLKRHSMSTMIIVLKTSDSIIKPTVMPAVYLMCLSIPSKTSMRTQAKKTPISVPRTK